MKKAFIIIFIFITSLTLLACKDKELNTKDEIPPIIMLNNNYKYIIIKEGDSESYHEQLKLGVSVIDNIDENLTDKIIVYDDEVDINSQGEYTVSFFVFDSSNNQSNIITKDVIVQEKYTLIDYYPIWEGDIEGEKSAPNQEIFNGAWY